MEPVSRPLIIDNVYVYREERTMINDAEGVDAASIRIWTAKLQITQVDVLKLPQPLMITLQVCMSRARGRLEV